ncbi:MAG: hypothetical protein U0736_12890 [Gemmataceae bacterium]
MHARLLIALVLASFVVGCGGDRDRNINRDADRPRSGTPDEVGKPKDQSPKGKEPEAKEKAPAPKDARPTDKAKETK